MDISQELKDIRNKSKFPPEKLYAKSLDEQVILEIGTVDLDTRQCVATNPLNGITFIVKLDKLTFCNSDGSNL
jgi:hypothetical protein